MVKINTLSIPKSGIQDLTEQESQNIKGGNQINGLSATQPELGAFLGKISLALKSLSEALAAAAQKP
jgi:hypothetical protein